MKKTVYILGNTIVSSDSLPVLLMPKLQKKFPEVVFTIYDPTEEFPSGYPSNLIFIDTVFGIKKVTLFKDISSFSLSPNTTVHDFDLLINLRLLKKLKKTAQNMDNE